MCILNKISTYKYIFTYLQILLLQCVHYRAGMMHGEPPPAYSDDSHVADPIAGNNDNIKHQYNFHFSEETIRRG